MRCSAHQDPFHCFTFLFSPRPDIGVTKKELGKSRWGGWLRINRHVCLRLLNKWCVLLLWKVSRESRWKTSGKTASIQVEWNDERSCFSPRPCLTTRSSKGEKGTGWTTINYSSQVNNVFYNQRSFIGWDLHYLPFSLDIFIYWFHDLLYFLSHVHRVTSCYYSVHGCSWGPALLTEGFERPSSP